MIGAVWAWALVGIAAVVVLGVLLVLVLGAAGMPGDFLRRLGQSATAPPTHLGVQLPDEVPDAGAEETARKLDRD